MNWQMSWRADPQAKLLADRHYNRQNPQAKQFVPPGRALVLLSTRADAFWITSWPYTQYVKHAWAGAWMCSAFRNEGESLSSTLIREACAATVSHYGPPPELGMITFVDRSKVKGKRHFGRCYLEAGFEYPLCASCLGVGRMHHATCASCGGDGLAKTKAGLTVLQLMPANFPPAEAALPRSTAA